MFISEIVAVNVEEKLLDKDGKLCMDRAGFIYIPWSIGL